MGFADGEGQAASERRGCPYVQRGAYIKKEETCMGDVKV
jgi:hypothetical protein